MEYMREPHTALYVTPTGVGKTHKALHILETECREHFNLGHNKTYREQKWFWTDPDVCFIEPKGNIYEWLEKIDNLLAGFRTLLLVHDIIADESHNKKRQPLL